MWNKLNFIVEFGLVEWINFHLFLFNHFDAAEDRYSHSCSCGTADCGTFVYRLCPQLSVGFTSKENPVTEFTDRTMMIQLRCWVLFSASCIMQWPVMAVSLSNNGASRDEHHRFKSCNKPFVGSLTLTATCFKLRLGILCYLKSRSEIVRLLRSSLTMQIMAKMYNTSVPT